MSTYTKLRDGSWGVRVQGKATPGQTVTVIKKSGERKTETIGRVVWTDGAISLCSVQSSPTQRQGSGRSYREPMGRGHGTAAPVAGYSSYCTDNSSCRCYDCAS